MTRSRIFKETEQGQIDLFDLKVYFCLVSSLVISYFSLLPMQVMKCTLKKTIVWKILLFKALF